MKYSPARICSILWLSMALTASAQTLDVSATDNSHQLAARCAYTQSDDFCQTLASSSSETAQNQFPSGGRQFGRPQMPRPYGRPGYFYSPYDDGHHAAIGGLIGFGSGFALGAAANHNSTSRVGSGLLVGALGAVFGAAIGHGIATFPHASLHRRHQWPSEQEDTVSASSSSPSDPAAQRPAQQSPDPGN